MTGLLYLSLKHLLFHRVQTTILTLCIAVAVMLPAASKLLITRYQKNLTARADNTPLIAGAKGNRFELTLTALYFRESNLATIPYSEYERARDKHSGVVVPLNCRFTARDYPIVGVGFGYFKQRDLKTTEGTLPLQMGDVVLGKNVAEALKLKTGDAIFSDQKEIYDISKPPALKMHITGVLGESRSADDDAVFVDIKTIWILEGIAHGHGDVKEIDNPKMLLGKTDETVVVSPAYIEYNEVTPENIGSYHIHGDSSTLPLTAFLVWPNDEKAATILKGDINLETDYQMEVPRVVIDDLMAVVFRIKTIFDALSWVLGVSTVLLTILVILLNLRIRVREIETLHKIGCSRFAVAGLYAFELVAILVMSIALAVVVTALVSAVLPDLIRIV